MCIESTITFTINGEIYYAEQGTTHLDWFESSYNTLYDDITISFCDGENKTINESDVLINNEEYYIGDSYCF